MDTKGSTRGHLVIPGLLIVGTLAATAVRIPATSFRGYFHLGEAIIFTAALLFGPLTGAIAGSVGSALADLVLGVPVWAPFSFVIKGFEGFVVGFLSGQAEPRRDVAAMAAGGLVMIAGYAVAVAFIEGPRIVPREVAGDLGQVLVGGIIAFLVTNAVRRAYPEVAGYREGPGKRR
ncbi:MAG: ECF transporter S component [Bacillota bacterium]|jgi:uncharacterized membrane protein